MIAGLILLVAIVAYICWDAERMRRARARREEFRYLIGCKPWWGQR
jgi:hypothetical protein